MLLIALSHGLYHLVIGWGVQHGFAALHTPPGWGVCGAFAPQTPP
jgi:hypothetical protein